MPAATDYYRSTYQSTADAAAKAAGIPKELFSAVINQESGWNPYAVSSKGAVGLSQLMPGTARDLGVNAWNPAENINGGASYLGGLYKRFGNWRDSLAAYFMGPNTTNLAGGYSYADKILSASGFNDPMGFDQPSNMPGNTGDAAIDSPPSSAGSWLADFLGEAVKRAGFLILALLLIALGIWYMIANKQSGSK